MNLRVTGLQLSGTVVALICTVSLARAQQTSGQMASRQTSQMRDTTCLSRRGMSAGDMAKMGAGDRAKLKASCAKARTTKHHVRHARRTRLSTKHMNATQLNATSTTRIPITKEAVTTGTASGIVDTIITRPETTIVAPAPDTTALVMPETTTTPPPPMPMVIRHYGNFYVGIGAGAAVPTSSIRDAYNTGVNIGVPLGWDSPTSIFGLRLDLTYNNFSARSSFRNGTPTGNVVALTSENPQIWSALGDLKLRLPFTGRFANGATTGIYVLGGVDAHYLRNYAQTFGLTNPFTNLNADGLPVASVGSNGSLWRFGANAGGGVSFGFGSTELFLESRYVRIFTSTERTNYVPIILGASIR